MEQYARLFHSRLLRQHQLRLAVSIRCQGHGLTTGQAARHNGFGHGVLQRFADGLAQFTRTKTGGCFVHDGCQCLRGIFQLQAAGFQAGLVLVQHQGSDLFQVSLFQRAEGDYFIHTAQELRPQELLQRFHALFAADLLFGAAKASQGGAVRRTGLTKECIGYENGVLGGVISALTSFAAPGDAVLLHSPTYIGFTASVENNGYKIVHSPLVKDENGVWRMDFEDMDAKIKANHIHVAIFCSPHNPCGRVWERWELEKAMEVYRANDCLVISDEIWSDIILNGHKHIPTQSVSEDARSRTVALYAPSKTFNLAGLVGSYHIIYNPYLRDRVRAKSSKPHYNDMNVLSMHALIGAYKPEGYEWVEELRETISGNVNFACDYITQHFEGVSVSKPEGTYMLFLDCTDWCKAHGKTIAEVEKAGWNVGVAWQDGRMFHGPCAIRMNLALPLTRVQEAFERLDKYVFNEEWV